jgi:hypothetical protein
MLQTMGLRTGRSKKSDKFRLFQQPARRAISQTLAARQHFLHEQRLLPFLSVYHIIL